MSAEFTNFAASIASFKTIDGKELALGFENHENYKSAKHDAYLGASVGRYANRIWGPEIEANGEKYNLAVNEPPNVTLHGGPANLGKKDWEGPFEEERNGRKATVYSTSSQHLDQGFPGKVNVKVYYTTYSVEKDNGEKEFFLEAEYECKLADDSPVDETVINLTNHSYFNIAANTDSLEGMRVKVFSNKALLKDGNGKITGELGPNNYVPEDLSFFNFTKDGPVFDDAFATRDLDKDQVVDTRAQEPKALIHMYHPDTKVNLKIFSTDPVFQLYTADFLNIPKLAGETRAFPPRSGFATEPGRPTNAANIPNWRNWVTLKKGQTWGSHIIYANWIGELKEY